MANYYSFKLNLTLKTLEKYKSAEEKKELFEKILPENLDIAFEEGEVIENMIKYSITHETDNLFITDSNLNKFNDLIKTTEEMFKLYQILINDFQKTGNIVYPAKYVTLNEECKKNRAYLENKVPDLNNIYNEIPDHEVVKEIKVDRNLGIGITHFYKMLKIQKYMSASNFSFECFYEPKKECFYLEEREDFSEAKTEANILMELVNNNIKFTKKLGRVTIIEQYEEIKFAETTTSFTVKLVYPNDSPEDKITSELTNMSRTIGADSMKLDVKGENLNISEIESLFTKEGLAGYVSNVTSRGKTLKLKIVERLFG